ncbi:phosphopantetheine-binding protein [Dendronalium sp. ChiSLP03b]|uniref:phosphopantetheine-binding protein n=1 Tax=Dendronalium sp. ChiSLP03b TaxID=3075381 RepID=UPI002AD3A3CC|nr:phosphopantetheine-binding protein [Dendronalium sp. ChiSLP03b]MDZ8207179.1 phosphopantetheine-binding protein [Dendronalium sp. ChiSLP03b]
MQPIINILADIQKAISNSNNAIVKATVQQNLIQDQYTKAKAESKSAHEDALKAAFENDQYSAMQALFQEVVQEKFSNLLQSQINQQVGVLELLNNNLAVLNEIKFKLEKCLEYKTIQDENIQSLTSSSFSENSCHNLEDQEILPENFIVKRLKKVISEQQSIEVENISLDRSLVLGEYFRFFLSSSNNYDLPPNDLGLDNIDGIELLIAIEEEFEIEISDAEAETIRTVQELVKFISFKLNQTQTL